MLPVQRYHHMHIVRARHVSEIARQGDSQFSRSEARQSDSTKSRLVSGSDLHLIFSPVDCLRSCPEYGSLTLAGAASTTAIQSAYSSTLSDASPSFPLTFCAAQAFHYEALQLTVPVNGSFAFQIQGVKDTIGMIYEHAFDPSNPSEKLATSDKNSCPKDQFSIRISLKVNTTYILVVTTEPTMDRGNFTVIVSGPANVRIQRISK